jgi:signal transduction histidine kinase
MSRLRLPLRAALGISVLTLLLGAAAATAAGFLLEVERQRTDRGDRLAAAAAYVEQVKAQADTTGWHALTEKLAALRLSAQLTVTSPGTDPSGSATVRTFTVDPANSAAGQPTATYTFSVGATSETLGLNLYAGPVDRARELLVGFAFGLAAVLVLGTLLIWGTGRWLLTPLRRLSTQVDAVAGGAPIQTQPPSPIREVQNVVAAVEGMAARLTQTAEQDARLESERRLLVSSIAHDLRTPLFALRGYLDAIATGVGNPRERLDQARAKADQVDRLITGLFDYARAEIDQPRRLQETDLAAAVTDATAAFELAADERAVNLRVTAPAGTSVRIDRDGFERALANVLDNALRHTPAGGTIDITCGDDTDGAYVRVVDDGPGISADLLPRVFEPAVRADGARNSHTGGAGLGLTIAARLLEHQGGTIHAANAPDRGATLTLRLPRTAA